MPSKRLIIVIAGVIVFAILAGSISQAVKHAAYNRRMERRALILAARVQEIRGSTLAAFFSQLSEQTSAPIDVDWKALGVASIDRKTPYGQRLFDVSLKDALNAVSANRIDGTQLGWWWSGERIIISTADEVAKESTVTLIYDLHDCEWLRETPLPFETPSICYSTSAVTSTGGGPASPGLFGTSGTPNSNLAWTNHELDEAVINTVEDVVDPDSWRDAGGTVGMVKMFDGRLIVTQSQPSHAKLVKFLDMLRATNACESAAK